MVTRLIYLLLFAAPQPLIYAYLQERLPDPNAPRRAKLVRRTLAALFLAFNLPWLVVAWRVLFGGSVWGVGRIPFTGPWIAWQLLGWIFCALVAVYLLAKGVWWFAQRVRGAWYVVTAAAGRAPDAHLEQPRTTHHAPVLSRRRFLARATYAYAGVGGALAGSGIWSAYRLPEITRRSLVFPDLPPGLDGLTLLHLSDLHAGVHLGEDRMQEIVARVNALRPDLIVQTGDMIDISRSYIPPYVRAFRDLSAPLGVVTVLGNHDRYTGEQEVIRGCRDAGQVFLQNGCHVVERRGATLALLGVDDPHNWTYDDPQMRDVDAALRAAPPAPPALPRGDAFHILLAHRPGAWDSAALRGIPLTLAGHIHGGQFYVPLLGWSAGRLITKYVMGHFQRGNSQLYVSRGIGVVGVPIRVFAPPEIELFELRRTVGRSD
ncbi:MAG TPA: metallophosphoesterase [Gemmatimonadales bacterium]|nr:metallophosphoesterase [Gemmatimonadales bacterium]